MKRALALLLTLTLLAMTAAGAESLTRYNGLRDKMFRQIKDSGLRGSVKLTLEGDAEWAQPLNPFSGAVLEFRSLKTVDNAELRAYFNKDGRDGIASTHFWADNENLYMVSDVLLDTVLRFPWKGDFFASLTGEEERNPSLFSAFANAVLHGYQWDEITEPLRAEAENFLMAQAKSPEQITENGETLLKIAYAIPGDAVREELKTLVRIAIADDGIYKQLHDFYLTRNQREVALSESQIDYIDRVIDTLEINGEITVERIVTIMGELRSVTVTMPLPENAWGYTTLVSRQEGARQTYALEGEDAISVTYQKDGDTVTGHLEKTVKGERACADFSLTNTHSQITDSDQVDHEIDTWKLEATPAEDTEKTFGDVSLSGYFHFYSRPGQTSRTTLEVDLSGRAFDEQIALTGKFVGVSKWEIIPISDVSAAQDVTAMTAEKRQELLSDFIANTVLILTVGDKPVSTPIPEEEAAEAVEEQPAEEQPVDEPASEEESTGDESKEDTDSSAEVTEAPQAAETAAPAEEQSEPEIVEEDIDLDEEAAD